MTLQVDALGFRDIADSLPALIWLSSATGTRDFFNRSWLEFTGRELAAEQGDGWLAGVHADDQQRCREIYAQAFAARRPVELEYRLRHASGEYRWLADYGRPRYDGTGEFLGFVGHCDDLSALKRAQEALAVSEEEFRSLVHTIPCAVFRCALDQDWTVRYLSAHIANIAGYSPQEFGPHKLGLTAIMHPEDRTQVQREMRARVAVKQGYILEHRIVDAIGGTRWVLHSGKAHFSDKGKALWLSGAMLDITDFKLAEDQLRQAAIFFENTTEGIMGTDTKGRIVAINQAFTQITGYALEEVLGRDMKILSSRHHGKDAYQAMWSALKESGNWRGEIWNRHKNGAIFPLLLTISAVRDASGKLSGYVSMFSDISHIKQAEARLEQLAYHDALTGLPNRLLFDERLEHAIQQAVRHDEKLAVLYFDLDRFKLLNDSLGHQVGDELLEAIASRLAARLRKSDTLSRRGGDEFTILLENIHNAEQAGNVARDILKQCAQPYLLPSGHQVQVGTSIGISLFPDDAEDAAQLIKYADTAMYEAKEGGRNQFRFYTPELTQGIRAEQRMLQRLRGAVEQHGLGLVYQPLYDIDTGRLVGVEALLRWDDAELGDIPPDRFIPLAEASGLIEQLGKWALSQACAQAVAWQQAGLSALRMAVNISAQQLRNPEFATFVAAALEETGLAPALLELELDEVTLLKQGEAGVDALQRLRDLGVSITVEDFGLGYSSLSRLQHLPVDRLKIDRSFVRDIPTDDKDMQLVSMIVAMAKTLRMGITAEGVETAEQLSFLRAQHCDLAQGYLLSHPVQAAQIPHLIRAGARLEGHLA